MDHVSIYVGLHRYVANDDRKPRRANALDAMEKALGRNHYTREASGKRRILVNGKWTRPLSPEEFLLAGNRKLKSEGKPQITGDPRWRA